MKLPRGLLLGLVTFIALTVLGACAWGCWWWIKWPERTAHEFARLMGEYRHAEADRMLRLDRDPETSGYGDWRSYFQWAAIELDKQPTLADLLNARRSFHVKGIFGTFRAERGWISFEAEPGR